MGTKKFLRSALLALSLVAAVLTAGLQPVRAALQASPAWYGATAAASSAWHYRVPLTLATAPAANAMAVFNVDFAALLASLGVTGTFDANSPRVVDTANTLVPAQEFSDTLYNGATDAVGNARGEIRFLTTSANTTYWLYFDITENGAKTSNAAAAIDANFENPGTTGSNTTAPRGWTVTRAANAVDTQVRPSESPSITTDGANATRTVDGTPRSGAYSFLIGARTSNEPGTGGQDIMLLRRTFTVPATNPGDLKVRFRTQGWDSNDNGNTGNYDYLEATVTDGTTPNNFIGPLANNYTTLPFSPNKGTAAATTRASGYGQYNGFDTDTNGTHRAGMTVARGSEPWWEATVNLAPYAGKTVTLTFTSSHVNLYRSWWHIDDVEWSVVNGTVGAPQGFGAALELPAAGTVYYPGDKLALRARLDATGKTGAVVADLYRPDGSLALAGMVLYNDATHGDTTSGDALWSNNGSVVANPTYTFATGNAAGAWSVVLRAADASTAASGQPAGLVRIPGQPVTPVNGADFSNVDVQALTFSPFMTISGKVYVDANRSGTPDTGEAAATGMYVKLLQGGAVVQVATPDASGAYSFNGLRAGTFTVLQSTNNLTTDTNPSLPANTVQSDPGVSVQTVTLAGGTSVVVNFGQYTADSRLSGKIFSDNGAGNATALDGVQGAGEAPMDGLTVLLLDAQGTRLAQAVTRGDGQFDLALPPAAAGKVVSVVIPTVTGYKLGRIVTGSTSGTVSLAAGTLAFTPAASTDYTGVTVSLLPAPVLAQGQMKTAMPGTVASYAHRFTAGANGTVTFTLASQPPAALPQWAAVLYRDVDCKGSIDGTDSPLTGSVVVKAGESVCLVVRDLVPQSAGLNVSNQHQLGATLVVSEGVGYAWAAVTNLDMTTVGAATGAGLTLTKAVRNLTTGSGYDTSGQALPGQTLQYRLTFQNDTPYPITSVQVNDYLPAYATFVGATCRTVPAGMTCTVSKAPATGASTGAIQWSLTGSVPPGAAGEVSFDWTLMN